MKVFGYPYGLFWKLVGPFCGRSRGCRLLFGGGAGGDGGEWSEVLLGEGLELGGSDVLDGIEVFFTGDHNTLVIRNQDEFGTLAAVTTILNQLHINVGNMSVHRDRRGGDALMVLETDQHLKPSQVQFLRELPGVISITYFDKEVETYGT